MRRLVAILFLISAGFTFAQNGFTHGPDQGIEQSYFDPSLAPFYHGVASGDPLEDRVIIWTRVTPAKDTLVPVNWVMALDTGFQNVVARGSYETDYTKDYTVKIDVKALQPNTTYYYHFSALNKNSVTGRTRTLPGNNTQHVRLAFGSCSNYQMGYFNSYKKIAERNDLDAVLHLGDYIYEYATYGYGYSVEIGREHRPNHEILTLDDYRIRHNFYKLDPDLKAAHQQHPFICIWDDHEIANNTYETGAANHQELSEGDFQTRKEGAIRAYLEWMPIRHPEFTGDPKIYRSFSFGDLLDLHMLDTRVEDRDQPAINVQDPLFNDTSRLLLGDVQRNWLFDKMDESDATWRIIGNQIMISETGENDADMDSWTGYPYERQLVIDKLKSYTDKNSVVLTGDTHRSWAFDLSEHPFDGTSYEPLTGQGTFGVEICSPSLASPNRNESNPGTSQLPDQMALLVENPHLRYVDLDNHGYVILDITDLKMQADFFYTETTVPNSTKDSLARSVFTYVNEGYLQEALSAATGKENQMIPAPSTPRPYSDSTPTLGLEQGSNYFLSGVYPNPSSGQFTLGLTNNTEEVIDLKVFDLKGRLVLDKAMNIPSGNHKIVFNLDKESKGVYILKINSKNGTLSTRKLVKK
ncbi:alkaline phosphatase D family protein [Brumimicrobium aurantiacum]|uniref:T9SS C-terminal target domain-containing protein n=1 Tax=Brumimicrobium aurantiacum TaxID=1737063 RepID=A0A3E1EXH8_9FLAO|nr:alkaline phosphatase D family protein [Brumimicrobium aurantiacum]RFC54238.1 T9SS C-terminal target domain-containing protein [Brumimicrobium aurantiacum]